MEGVIILDNIYVILGMFVKVVEVFVYVSYYDYYFLFLIVIQIID